MQKQTNKIRILLVSNPVNAFFMRSYLEQILNNNSEYNNVFFYTDIDFDESSWESTWGTKCVNLKEKIELEKLGSRLILESKISSWIECMPKRYSRYNFKLNEIKKIREERRNRKKELQFIKNILKENALSPDSIYEIWYSNSVFTQHFFYLCTKAIGFSFEHGLGEVKLEFTEKRERNKTIEFFKPSSWLVTIKHKVKILLQNVLVYFSHEIVNKKSHISLFGDEIKITDIDNSIITLDPINCTEVSKSVMDVDIEKLSFLNGSRNALVLMPTIKSWAKNEQQHLDFFRSFEKYLLEDLNDLFQKNLIDTIIFKTKTYIDDYCEEGFSNFKKLKNKYKLCYLPHFSKNNFPAEMYLSLFQPQLILGAHGAALFYSKKINPNIHTYSFDRWYNEYCDIHFGTHLSEYDTLIDFYHKKYSREFKDSLPIRL